MSKKILSLVLSVSMCLTMLCVSALSVGAKSIEDDSCKEGETVAVLKTNYGDIAIKFFDDIAPKACENFIGLAKDGKYDNTIFHRVISDFMIQGGDFENFDGTGGTSIWNKDFENEVDDDFSNIRGAVAMANSGPDTNGSQFYINAVDNTYLDGDYTVFGFVVSGMDVVDMIEGVSTDDNDKPLNDVSLNTVEVTKYSEDLISSLSVASNPYEGADISVSEGSDSDSSVSQEENTEETNGNNEMKVTIIVFSVIILIILAGVAYSLISSKMKKKKKAKAKEAYKESHKYDKNKKKKGKKR